jgi:hypothetical protein
MIFTIEFFRIRPSDDAHATLDRFSVIIDDLDAVKVKARSLFETLKMPQKPDGLRILDEGGCELEALKARSAPPDVIGNAVHVLRIATGEIEDTTKSRYGIPGCGARSRYGNGNR